MLLPHKTTSFAIEKQILVDKSIKMEGSNMLYISVFIH